MAVDKRRTGREGTWDIKNLWERNHEILRLIFLGWKDSGIAQELQVTKTTVSNTRNSTLGQKKLQIMRDARDADSLDVGQRLAELAPKAVEIYEEILEEESDQRLRKATADTILKDILGHEAPKRVEGKFAYAHLTKEDLDDIKKRNKEAAAAAGIVSD